MKAGVTLILLIGTFAFSSGQSTPSCIGLANGYKFNNPSVQNNYYLCLDGVPIPMKCKDGLIFCAGGTDCIKTCPVTTTATTTNTATTTTTAKPTIPTTKSPVDCSDDPNGTLYANPSDCNAYYMCVNGKPVPGKCLGNLAFDKKTGSCSSVACTS